VDDVQNMTKERFVKTLNEISRETLGRCQSLREDISHRIEKMSPGDFFSYTPEHRLLMVTTPPVISSSLNPRDEILFDFHGNKELQKMVTLGDVLPAQFRRITKKSSDGERREITGEFYAQGRITIGTGTRIIILEISSEEEMRQMKEEQVLKYSGESLLERYNFSPEEVKKKASYIVEQFSSRGINPQIALALCDSNRESDVDASFFDALHDSDTRIGNIAETGEYGRLFQERNEGDFIKKIHFLLKMVTMFREKFQKEKTSGGDKTFEEYLSEGIDGRSIEAMQFGRVLQQTDGSSFYKWAEENGLLSFFKKKPKATYYVHMTLNGKTGYFALRKGKLATMLEKEPGRIQDKRASLMKNHGVIMKKGATKHNVPLQILFQVLAHESHGDELAFSMTYCTGIGQQSNNISMNFGEPINPFNPKEAIMRTAKYLGYLYGLFGNWEQAITAYNGGEKAVSDAMEEAEKNNGNWREYLKRDEPKKYYARVVAEKSWEHYENIQYSGQGLNYTKKKGGGVELQMMKKFLDTTDTEGFLEA